MNNKKLKRKDLRSFRYKY